jgi:hypothetical protein
MISAQEVVEMKSIALAILGLFAVAPIATANPSWIQISFATTAENAPKILAAADTMTSSAVFKQFPGKLLLQAHIADGSNPATHSFVPIYKSTADRESFLQKLQADPAWATFTATMGAASQPVSTVLFSNLKSWGDVNDTDHVWAAHVFNIEDPAALVAAVDKLMASKTGKKFPGQVHLSAVVAGGMTPVTHTISVGYASQTEMDAWISTRNASKDWTAYQDSVEDNAEFLGTSLARDLKTWGSAALADLTAR